MKKAVKICSQYLFVFFLFFLLVPASLFGQTVTVYEETFDSPWNTGDWDQYTPEGGSWATQLAPFICQGDQSVSHWDNGEPVNGWIISDLISLQAGITYTCSFQQRVGNSSFPENMGTYIYQGNGADFTPGTATAVIWQADNLTNETCSSRSNTFTVPSDGNYNIVFHCTSAADEFIAIWDYIKITRPTTTQAPTVTTQAVTGITITTATGNGNITDLGTPNPTAHGVAWNTAGTPTLADNNTDEGAAGATGAFTGNITGLSPKTTYYVRAYATNTVGTSYGNEVSFTTLAPEINLKQGATDIADGGSHDFGSQATGTDTDLDFTIENSGTADLTLSGTPVITITGTNSDQFSVQAQPTSPVTGSNSTTFTIRFSPTSIGAKTATISIANNDSDENPYDLTITGTGTTAGITIGALSSTTTNEDGSTATFTVVLDSKPTDNVAISLSSSDTSEGTVSSASLTFTSANWSTAQTVTVTGVNDDLFDGDIAYTVAIGPAESNDSGYDDNDPADQDLTNNDNDLDSDGDGISDSLEGTGDRDGDGIDNCNDYDPTGYLYDSATGEIVSGGSISVSGPGNVTFVAGLNGTDGYYQFVVDQVGTYTIAVTPPAGYSVDSSGCAASGTLTANSTPNPLILGSSEYGPTGYLADYTCGANEWYLTVNIQDTTPLILNNNIPLEESPAQEPIPTLNEWGMIITSCLLAFAAFTVLRRREEM